MATIWFMGIAMALVGLGVAGWAVRHYRRNGAHYNDAVARWSKVRGRVLDARLVERESTDSNDTVSTVYEPRIRYSYTVGTELREGERINLCNVLTFHDGGRAEQWLAAHPADTPIEIWFDPSQPEHSACTLDKPNLISALFTGVAGIGVLALGIWLLFNIR